MPIEPRQKERWLREFHLNGFVVLRDFLPRELVEAMHEQIVPLIRGEYERAQQGASSTFRAPGRLSFDVGRYADLLGGALGDERYRRHPVIEELVDTILTPAGRWERGWTRVEAVWKGSNYMDWHSDQTMDATPDNRVYYGTVRVTYNIPLVDLTWASGPTEFLPGSHRHPREFLNAPFTEIANLYPIAPMLRRGDALLRDGNMLHRGSPNLTDEPRPMLDQTYRVVFGPREGGDVGAGRSA